MGADYCLLLILSSTTSPRFPSSSLSHSVPNLCWCMRLFHPRHRNLRFSLLNFRKFLLVQFSCFSKSCWVKTLSLGISITFPHWASSWICRRIQTPGLIIQIIDEGIKQYQTTVAFHLLLAFSWVLNHWLLHTLSLAVQPFFKPHSLSWFNPS